MKLVVLTIAVALAGVGGSSLAAQQTPPQPRPTAPGPPEWRGEGPWMGGAWMRGPWMEGPWMQGPGGAMMGVFVAPQGAQEILAMREALRLTDSQVNQLRTIARQTREAVRPSLTAAARAHAAAFRAMEAEPPNLATFRTQMQTAANDFVQAQVAVAGAAAKALAILTPEQRSNVRFMMRLHHYGMLERFYGHFREGYGRRMRRDSVPR